MRWQLSARLTSLIVLGVVSLAVGGAALGLALARGGSGDAPQRVAAHMQEARSESRAKADSRTSKRGYEKGRADGYVQSERQRIADRHGRGSDSRGRAHNWWGSRRVIVVPRFDGYPRPFSRADSPFMRRFERVMPDRRVAPLGGIVIAVGEVTAAREGVVEMFTVLGNEVTIDISQLRDGIAPEVGEAAIVIAERDGDGYVAQSLDLLDVRLSDMLEGMRARSRAGS